MKCARCGHWMANGSGIEVPSSGGTLRFGPKCAIKAGLVRPKPRVPKLRLLTVVVRRDEVDPRQMNLELLA